MGGRVEPEVAAVAGEADAERHLARRRCGELAVHRVGAMKGRPFVSRLKSGSEACYEEAGS